MKTTFLLTDDQLRTLVRDHDKSLIQVQEKRGTYLKALLAHTQESLGKGRDPLKVLDQVHERMYGVVLSALDPKLDALARNAKSAFARSAYSVLRAWAKAGGSIRKLDPEDVTREALRAATDGPRIAPATQVERTAHRILRIVEKMAPDRASTLLTEAISMLQAKLDELHPGVHVEGAPGDVVKSMRGRVRRVPAEHRAGAS